MMSDQFEPFAISVKQAAFSESTCIANIYKRLSAGEYVALKDGRRTLILWESIKARRAKLQPAKFKQAVAKEAAQA
jgi:hypothetical protein